MRAKNRYILLGWGLLVTGVWLIPVAHFVLESTPLTATGSSLIILGVVSVVLGRTRPSVSPEISALLLDTSLENISAIIEELGLRTKAVYLPSSMTQGQPRTLIPLRANHSVPLVGKALPRRLIVRYGPSAEDIGLLISTPGSASLRMLETAPGSSSSEMEEALASVLGGMLDIADGVRVATTGKTITVEITNPRVEHKSIRFYECLGSPLASIAAAVVAEALDRPVAVEREEYGKGKSLIELGILG